MTKDKGGLYCSFCGKRSTEVKKLIAGPTVFICNECVDMCHEICHELSDNLRKAAKPITYRVNYAELASFEAFKDFDTYNEARDFVSRLRLEQMLLFQEHTEGSAKIVEVEADTGEEP